MERQQALKLSGSEIRSVGLPTAFLPRPQRYVPSDIEESLLQTEANDQIYNLNNPILGLRISFLLLII